MALLPLALGLILGSAPWIDVLLLCAAWFAAFASFHALELSARASARRRPALVPALASWCTLTAVLGVPLLIRSPGLMGWAPAIVPLLALVLIEAARARTRSICARSAEILASSLMTPVAAGLGQGSGGPNQAPAQAFVLGAVLAAYFLGTLPYVRSLVRGRGETRWILASGIIHALGLILVIILTALGRLHPALVLVWVGLALRAIVLPLRAGRGAPIPPKRIGLAEMGWSLLVWGLLVLSA